MAKCKRCGLKTVLSGEDIEKMVGEIKSMKGVKLAEESVYKARLDVCAECEKLEYGSTCMACGCVVAARALIADGKCPMKKWY